MKFNRNSNIIVVLTVIYNNSLHSSQISMSQNFSWLELNLQSESIINYLNFGWLEILSQSCWIQENERQLDVYYCSLFFLSWLLNCFFLYLLQFRCIHHINIWMKNDFALYDHILFLFYYLNCPKKHSTFVWSKIYADCLFILFLFTTLSLFLFYGIFPILWFFANDNI